MKNFLEMQGELVLLNTNKKEIKKMFGRMYTSEQVDEERFSRKFCSFLKRHNFDKNKKNFKMILHFLNWIGLIYSEKLIKKNVIFGNKKSGSIYYNIVRMNKKNHSYLIRINGKIDGTDGTSFIEWLVPIIEKKNLLYANIFTTDLLAGQRLYQMQHGCKEVQISQVIYEPINSVKVPKPEKFKIAS